MTRHDVGQGQEPPRPRAGSPIDRVAHDRVASHFDQRFDHVRVHDDPEAHRDALSHQARAFTVGTDIYFAAGQYRPETFDGQVLLAHELAHVSQQRSGHGQSGGALTYGTASDEVAANQALVSGDLSRVRRTGLRLQRCPPPGGSTSTAPGPGPAPAVAPPPVAVAPLPVAPQDIFERPAATTPAGAATSMIDYANLSQANRAIAFATSYPSGRIKAALTALTPRAAVRDHPTATRDLLDRIIQREGAAPWAARFLGNVEREVAVAEAGVTEGEMAQRQAVHEAARPPARGWGGTTSAGTRWSGLGPQQRAGWTRRATAAKVAMAAYAVAHHPELNVTAASFEWEPHRLDMASLGAIAAVGSNPGVTLLIGFEFVVLVETNPAYAMSTIAHELLGHDTYDQGGSNFQAELYDRARSIDPSLPAGSETYHYWASEIYSLLREFPYWTQVSAADETATLNLPRGRTRHPQDLNYDPRGAIEGLLRRIRDRWDPTLVVPLCRGYTHRLRVDPLITSASLAAFEQCVRNVFPQAEADRILK